jgi:hypothetical protein
MNDSLGMMNIQEKFQKTYDASGRENLMLLARINYQVVRYCRTCQIDGGGLGWEDPNSRFHEVLGADVAAKYSTIEDYLKDKDGRKELAQNVRKDCLVQVSSLLGIDIKTHEEMNVVAQEIESLGDFLK